MTENEQPGSTADAAEHSPMEEVPAMRVEPPGPRPSCCPLAAYTVTILLLILLAVSRFADLGHRAIHHDESIHGLGAWNLAHQGPRVYFYNPVYHGPFLYHFGALFQLILPDSDASVRAPYALVGILLGLFFLAWRKMIGLGPCLIIMSLITFSPILTYYSRFARDDVYTVAWMAGTIISVTAYLRGARTRHLILAVFFVTLAYCTKENSYITNFILCSFLVLWAMVRLVRRPRRTMEEIFFRYLPLTRLLILIGCFSVFVFTYVGLDCRLGPKTDLKQGVVKILKHSVEVTSGVNPKEFKGQSGYFRAPARKAARRQYIQAALAITIFLLTLAEAIALWLERRKRRWGARIRFLPRWLWHVAGTLGFYGLMAYLMIDLIPILQKCNQKNFFGILSWQLAWRGALLAVAAAALMLPDWIAGCLSSVAREKTRAGWTRMLGLWGLVAQLTVAQAIYWILFSSLGANARRGPVAGLYDYLAYWFRHQTSDFRIWGTWWYYLPRLFLYELFPIMLILVVGLLFTGEKVVKLLRRGRRPAQPPAGEGSVWWKPIPPPLLWFSVYLAVSLLGIYSLLNEKVPWLATYPAFGIILPAGLLAGHWLARRPPAGRRGCGALVGRMLIGLLLGATAIFASGQYMTAVFLRSDVPSELILYTATTQPFAQQMRRIKRLERETMLKRKEPFVIAFTGIATSPGNWYLRNSPVKWGATNLPCDIQVLDDTPENRKRMELDKSEIWQVESAPLRGWWIWWGNTRGLPGGLGLWGNLKAFFKNQPNDQRNAFAPEDRPPVEAYPTGFARQVLGYIFQRTIWVPTAAPMVLICVRKDRGIPLD